MEASPEFQKALNEACERRYREYLFGGEYAKAHSNDTIADTMEEMQRRREEIEAKADDIRKHAEQVRQEARIRMDPHMREITANLKRRQQSSGLVCPLCGESDHGNRMNGKAYCFMNAKHKGLGPIPLMTPEKAKDWKPPKKKKANRSYTFNELDGVVRKRG